MSYQKVNKTLHASFVKKSLIKDLSKPEWGISLGFLVQCTMWFLLATNMHMEA